MGKSWILLVAVSCGLGVLVLAQNPLPHGPGAKLVYTKCQACHGIEYVTDSAGISRSMWDDTISEMEEYGMAVTAKQREIMLNYLATYLGPHPPAKTDSAVAAPKASNHALDGAELYANYCSACHQPNGQGQTGMTPPLAGNTVLTKDRRYGLLVVLYGLEGEVEVGGHTYQNAMPPLQQLEDAEIAAILNHILTAWGNEKLLPRDFKPLSAEEVTRARDRALTPQQVWQIRKRLK